jgi:hypothetical protein
MRKNLLDQVCRLCSGEASFITDSLGQIGPDDGLARHEGSLVLILRSRKRPLLPATGGAEDMCL